MPLCQPRQPDGCRRNDKPGADLSLKNKNRKTQNTDFTQRKGCKPTKDGLCSLAICLFVHNNRFVGSWKIWKNGRPKSSPIWKLFTGWHLSHGLCAWDVGQHLCHDHGHHCTNVFPWPWELKILKILKWSMLEKCPGEILWLICLLYCKSHFYIGIFCCDWFRSTLVISVHPCFFEVWAWSLWLSTWPWRTFSLSGVRRLLYPPARSLPETLGVSLHGRIIAFGKITDRFDINPSDP